MRDLSTRNVILNPLIGSRKMVNGFGSKTVGAQSVNITNLKSAVGSLQVFSD